MVNDPSQWLLALHLWKLYAHLISLFIELSILVLFWDSYTFYPVRLQLPKTFFHVAVFIWLFAIRKFLLVPRFICQFLVFLPSYWCSSQKVLLPMPISWSVLLQQIESFRSYTKVFDLLRIYFRQDKKKHHVPILFFWICPVSSTLCWRGYLSSICVFGILVKNHMVQCVGLMLSSLLVHGSVCISHGSTRLLRYHGPALGLTRHGDITSTVHFILDWFGYSGCSLFPSGFYSYFLYSCKECHWVFIGLASSCCSHFHSINSAAG